jgi:23S rRNA (adenine1618-N6)-methyltransferase
MRRPNCRRTALARHRLSAAGGPARSKAQTPGLHPRNRHRGRYDFAELLQASPALAPHVIRTAYGEDSIDFSDAAAVRELNRAVLAAQYGIRGWEIPPAYLCPPVPGRADYLHGLADLLAEDAGGEIPRGSAIRALDIGVGANCIYPLLGQVEYGWQFVGSDIDSAALAAAQRILDANPALAEHIELRLQAQRGSVFSGLLGEGELFDLSLCNPPFHASAEDAARGSQRKWNNLGKPAASKAGTPALNFGGTANELWCTGGEASFLRRMIRESAALPERICWFSSLVAKSEHLPELRKQLSKAGAVETREIAMAQGNKRSRFLAWTFLDATARRGWRARRWPPA